MFRTPLHSAFDRLGIRLDGALRPSRIDAQHGRHAMPMLLGDPQRVLPIIRFQRGATDTATTRIDDFE
jgi:hypothetical protein